MARLYRRFTPWDYSVFGLAIAGFVIQIFRNFFGILFGLLIIAAIAGMFLYEKRMSGRSGAARYRNTTYNRNGGTRTPPPKRKSTFRVIPGSKPDDKPH